MDGAGGGIRTPKTPIGGSRRVHEKLTGAVRFQDDGVLAPGERNELRLSSGPEQI